MCRFLHVLYIIIFIRKNVIAEIEYYPSMREINTLQNVKVQRISRHKINITDHFNCYTRAKRAADPVFRGNPKTREELWHERFLHTNKAFDQIPSLIQLIHNITLTYLNGCIPVLLYDSQIKSERNNLIQDLLKTFPVTFSHGHIDDTNHLAEPGLLKTKGDCLHFILFLTDVQRCAKIMSKQSKSKIIVVTESSQWAVQEFLASPASRMFINLLIISPSFKDDDVTLEASYIIYTHTLYTDGLGSSKPRVLTSWSHGKFTRNTNLFPSKITKGYAGHRFLIAVAHQPPYTIKKLEIDPVSGSLKSDWDGVEIRLMKLLAEKNNFSIEFVEPKDLSVGSGDAVAKEVASGHVDMGIAGLYATQDRIRDLDLSFGHSQDCATFITLASTALPRYRAILGPFHWHVWIALTFTYLIGIFPLAFSDKHTLRHLINNSGEVENMFWYVFGTFTNCFTFVGKNSWSKTDKITTRLLIGWYWLFTIIITSCYTGSIIAFVTLPLYPETVDSVSQLLGGFFRVGTLDRGGWEKWFLNSSDPATRKLLKKLEFVPDVETGIRNVTKAFFWPYAFIGSKSELEYLVLANYTKSESKRSVLHVSNECFVPFTVAFSFPKNSAHTTKLSADIRKMYQSGMVDKIKDDLFWELQRHSKGTLLVGKSTSLSSNSLEEKGLTLDDTQGMFLLLGAGFLIAATALLSEWMGGFTRKCREIKRKLSTSKEMVPRTESNDRKFINTRSTSLDSEETLNGKIIHVAQENITIHNNYDVYEVDSRRSSSVDLDQEVQKIFLRAENKEAAISESESAASKVFGDHVLD